MLPPNHNALVLSPHPDDAELGMSALIFSHPETTFHIVTLSKHGPNDPTCDDCSMVRLREVDNFWKGHSNVRRYHNPHPLPRILTGVTVSDVTAAVEHLNLPEFRMVFSTSKEDSNVEHALVYQAAEILCRRTPCDFYTYGSISLLEAYAPNTYFPLDTAKLSAKISALQNVFLTQARRSYFGSEQLFAFHSNWHHVRRGIPFAESFQCIRAFI